MSEQSIATSTYDWDRHFRIAEDLRHLDMYQLQMMGKRRLDQSQLKNHLTKEFFLAIQNRDKLPVQEAYDNLSSAVQRMIDQAERHASQSAGRAYAIANHARDLVRLFPEKHYRSFVEKELELRQTQIQDLYDNVLNTRPLYYDGGREFHNTRLWDSARESIENEMRRYQEIVNSAARGDQPGITASTLHSRALDFALRQEDLAEGSLSHAETQMNVIEECLRIATTIKTLPAVYYAQLESRMKTLIGVAGGLMVVADFTLGEAADLRQSANLSRNVQRPIFKVTYP